MGSASSKPESSAPHVWKGCVHSRPKAPCLELRRHQADTVSQVILPGGGVAKPSRVHRDQQRGQNPNLSRRQRQVLALAGADPRPQTDVSRLQALELRIQERVAAELKRLRAQEAEALREAQQKLSAEPAPDHQGEDLQKQLEGGPTRQEVSKAIGDLRAKLEERKKVRQLPDSLESARSEVVRCLRENDRRPLDCWREVEAFKEEVRRLEKGWVEKVIS